METATTDADRKSIAAEAPRHQDEIYQLLSQHGKSLYTKADYAGAIQAYRAALVLSTARADDRETARNLSRIGSCLYRQHDLNNALEPLNRAVELATRAGDKATTAEALQALANSNLLLGKLDDAERLARRCVAAYEDLGDKRQAIAMTVNLSTVLGEKGDQEAKAELLRRVISQAEESAYKDILARALNNLGVVYYDQGDYERSLQYVQRAIGLFVELNSNLTVLDQIQSNIGVMNQYLGRDKEALDAYAKAEAMSVKAGDRPQQMHIKNNRASLYREAGQPAKALDEIREVSEYYATSPLRTDALRVEGEYAQTLLACGQTEEAIRVASKALAEARDTGGPDIIRLLLAPLGEAYLQAGKRAEARAAFLEAIAAIESIRLSGREDEKENFFHQKSQPYQGMVRLAREEGNTLEALQYAERAKARLLLDVLQGERAGFTRAMSDAEKQKESELNAAVVRFDTQLAKEGSRAGSQLLLERTKSALALDEFHDALYRAHPNLRLERAEFQPISTAQLRDLAPDNDTALIEFTVTPTAAYVFAITRGADGEARVETRDLRDPATLDAAVAGFRAQLAAHDLGYRTTAQALYTRILGPAAAALKGKKRLVIVPDGPLWGLPFQALLSPRGKHLIEESAVFYAPSLTAVHAMQGLDRSPSEASRTLLAMAALAETAGEARQIGRLYGTSSAAVFVGEQVTKERWNTEAPRYRILHLATHGVLNGNNPLSSYLVMSGDNTLTAREILKMNLHADVAVLSACETARGRFRFGEGMIGMSWAFLVAGTPTTVVSQWKVDSAATSQLMVAFHRNLKVHDGTPVTGRMEALRQAELELLATPEYKHPFYWAGFVMIGDGF